VITPQSWLPTRWLREHPDALVCGLSTNGLIVKLRASVEWPAADARTITAEALVASADVAMYESKDQGHGLPRP